jgi:hypothetical protein
MARLWTNGFELGDSSALKGTSTVALAAQGSNPIVQTTNARSGSYSALYSNVGTTVGTWLDDIWSGVTGRDYFCRFYLRFDANPAQESALFSLVETGGQYCGSICLDTDGTLTCRYGASQTTGTLLGTSSALSVDTWYRVEYRVNIGSTAGDDQLEARVDGTQFANGTSLTIRDSAPAGIVLGIMASTPNANIYMDDVAVNDDQGASQNTWPGAGNIVRSIPISDQSRTGWTDNAGATTNLYEAVDNIPPIGEPASVIPTVVGSAGSSGNLTTSATATIPAYQSGDIIYVSGVNGGATANLSCADNGGQGAYTADAALTIGIGRSNTWWRRATGSGSGHVVTVSGGTNSTACSVMVIRNAVSSGSPLDVTTSAVAVTSARSGIAAGITPTTNNCLLLGIVNSRDNIDTSAFSTVNTGAFTAGPSGTSAGGNDTQSEIWSDGLATAGATGNVSFTNAAAAGIDHGIHIAAIKPRVPTAKAQIRDPNANSSDTFIANMQSYTTVGVGASDTVKMIQAVAIGSDETGVSQTNAVRIESNPGPGTEATASTVGASAGTHPTGWLPTWTAPVYDPTVTKGTSPQIRVRRGSATGGTHVYEHMGLLIEYQEPQTITHQETGSAISAFIGSGPDEWTLNRTGIGISPYIGSGADAATLGRAGIGVVGPKLGYAGQVLFANPALYWRLGETSGTNANDETANNRDGTYSGSLTLNQTGLVTGDSNKAVDFAGGNVLSTYSPFASAQLSFEGIAVRDNSSATHILVGASNGSFGGRLRVVTGGNDVNFEPQFGFNSVTWGNAWPGNSILTHWILTFDQTNDIAELFIDGISKGTRSLAQNFHATPGDFMVGSVAGGTEPWDGIIDEIAVYTYLLSSTQAIEHARAVTSGLTAIEPNGFVGSGAKVREYGERGGSSISAFIANGADVSTFAELGVGISPFTGGGVWEVPAQAIEKLGLGISPFVGAGFDSFTAVESGFGQIDMTASGDQTNQYNRQNYPTPELFNIMPPIPRWALFIAVAGQTATYNGVVRINPTAAGQDMSGTSDTSPRINSGSAQAVSTERFVVEADVVDHAALSSPRLLGMRSATGNTSAHITITYDNDRSHLTLIHRDAANGATTYDGDNTGVAAPSLPFRLRMISSQDRLTATGYVSSDNGASWTKIGTHTASTAMTRGTMNAGGPDGDWVEYDNAILTTMGTEFAALSDSTYEYGEAGAGIIPFIGTGADVSEFSETGTGKMGITFNAHPKDGMGIIGFIGAGNKVMIFAEDGAGVSPFVGSGADVATLNRTGAGVSPFVGSGTDIINMIETGTAISALVGSGLDVSTHTESGAGISPFVGSGIRFLEGQGKLGTAISAFSASGSDIYIVSRNGTGISSFTGNATRQVLFAPKTGAGISPFTGSGTRASDSTYLKFGAGITPFIALGSDVFTATESGSGIVVMTGSGISFIPGLQVTPCLIFPLSVEIAPHISSANVDLITYSASIEEPGPSVAAVDDVGITAANVTEVLYVVEVSEGNYVVVLIDPQTLITEEWITC